MAEQGSSKKRARDDPHTESNKKSRESTPSDQSSDAGSASSGTVENASEEQRSGWLQAGLTHAHNFASKFAHPSLAGKVVVGDASHEHHDLHMRFGYAHSNMWEGSQQQKDIHELAKEHSKQFGSCDLVVILGLGKLSTASGTTRPAQNVNNADCISIQGACGMEFAHGCDAAGSKDVRVEAQDPASGSKEHAWIQDHGILSRTSGVEKDITNKTCVVDFHGADRQALFKSKRPKVVAVLEEFDDPNLEELYELVHHFKWEDVKSRTVGKSSNTVQAALADMWVYVLDEGR